MALSIALLKIPLIIIDALWMCLSGTPPNPPRPLKEHIIPNWRERFLRSLGWPGKMLRVRRRNPKCYFPHRGCSCLDDVLPRWRHRNPPPFVNEQPYAPHFPPYRLDIRLGDSSIHQPPRDHTNLHYRKPPHLPRCSDSFELLQVAG